MGLQWCQFESRVIRLLDIMMAIPGKLLVNVRGPWNRFKMSDFQVFWVIISILSIENDWVDRFWFWVDHLHTTRSYFVTPPNRGTGYIRKIRQK